MNRVLYLKTPSLFKSIHKSIMGKRIFKAVWGSYSLAEYLSNFSFQLIILPETEWKLNLEIIKNLPKATKVVVLSDKESALEYSDALINSKQELISKAIKLNLESNPQGLYLWALGEQIITRCNKCSSIMKETHFSCQECGSQHVEIAKSNSHLP